MTIRLHMLRAMQRAPALLHEATNRVIAFLNTRIHKTGGFIGRNSAPDLYYTVFGLESLISLDAPPPIQPMRVFLETFGAGDDLDLVHLCCLARLWADLPGNGPGEQRKARLVDNILGFQSADGGFNPKKRASQGTVYAAFLALGALQDLQYLKPASDEAARLADSVNRLKTPDGAYNNASENAAASVPVTAAALLVLKYTGAAIPPAAIAWLRKVHLESGGFPAVPGLPMADLLSTATALHALNLTGCPLQAIREDCLDFVDGLWTPEGGFYGHCAEALLDCEYTAYGLLALGNLQESTNHDR